MFSKLYIQFVNGRASSFACIAFTHIIQVGAYLPRLYVQFSINVCRAIYLSRLRDTEIHAQSSSGLYSIEFYAQNWIWSNLINFYFLFFRWTFRSGKRFAASTHLLELNKYNDNNTEIECRMHAMTPILCCGLNGHFPRYHIECVCTEKCMRTTIGMFEITKPIFGCCLLAYAELPTFALRNAMITCAVVNTHSH